MSDTFQAYPARRAHRTWPKVELAKARVDLLNLLKARAAELETLSRDGAVR
jgi:hypothetical protein